MAKHHPQTQHPPTATTQTHYLQTDPSHFRQHLQVEAAPGSGTPAEQNGNITRSGGGVHEFLSFSVFSSTTPNRDVTENAIMIPVLAIPMFSEGSLCPGCNVHRMDQWGDYAVHCSSEVGVKGREIFTTCRFAIIQLAPSGEKDRPLRPADMLLYSWDKGLDVCVDLTGVDSSFSAEECLQFRVLPLSSVKRKQIFLTFSVNRFLSPLPFLP
ncbi:hypothetical protein CTI12_AA334530 [Artemisia annua]|uniref:Uncharacterized protein n=1 Tax=Artemisia annua TaxID=35608 RepID=A0A2U1MWH8_ARTAN|nr:hypothetical protein CTI12_AA334530 [Artemisia annua]